MPTVVVIDCSSESDSDCEEATASGSPVDIASSQQTMADLSPGFRNAAAMAGWDDEALLLAALDIEENAPTQTTPKSNMRELKKREVRTPGQAATPASLNRIHRKPRRQALAENDAKSTNEKCVSAESASGSNVQAEIEQAGESTSSVVSNQTDSQEDAKPACLEQLRDELSCAVCLEICYEPSSTPCGHSFCRSCLQSVYKKCGLRCPKCRQILRGEGVRACSVNTVLWNTIQILFPNEREKGKTESYKQQAPRPGNGERQHSDAVSSRPGPHSSSSNHQPWRSTRITVNRSRPIGNFRRLLMTPPVGGVSVEEGNFSSRQQQELVDAALAMRLQHAELMQASN